MTKTWQKTKELLRRTFHL